MRSRINGVVGLTAPRSEQGRQAMQGQTNSTTQTIHLQPKETLVQAPRPATGLKVKTNIKAGRCTEVKTHVKAEVVMMPMIHPPTDPA